MSDDTLFDARGKRIAELEAQVATLTAERDAWQETARQNARNADFYQSLVTEIGMRFGVAARTADDGSVGDTVLALKVNDLVGGLTAQLAAAREALEAVNKQLWSENGVPCEDPDKCDEPEFCRAWHKVIRVLAALSATEKE